MEYLNIWQEIDKVHFLGHLKRFLSKSFAIWKSWYIPHVNRNFLVYDVLQSIIWLEKAMSVINVFSYPASGKCCWAVILADETPLLFIDAELGVRL